MCGTSPGDGSAQNFFIAKVRRYVNTVNNFHWKFITDSATVASCCTTACKPNSVHSLMTMTSGDALLVVAATQGPVVDTLLPYVSLAFAKALMLTCRALRAIVAARLDSVANFAHIRVASLEELALRRQWFTIRSLLCNFDQPLGVGVLPTSLRQLTLGQRFNQPLGVGVLPASLQQLTFGSCFNQPLGVGVLPASLQQLTFGSCFNQPLGVGVLPPLLQRLAFGWYFNQSLDAGVLPASLRQLSLPESFTHPLRAGVFPANLATLQVGASYVRITPETVSNLGAAARTQRNSSFTTC